MEGGCTLNVGKTGNIQKEPTHYLVRSADIGQNTYWKANRLEVVPSDSIEDFKIEI